MTEIRLKKSMFWDRNEPKKMGGYSLKAVLASKKCLHLLAKTIMVCDRIEPKDASKMKIIVIKNAKKLQKLG